MVLERSTTWNRFANGGQGANVPIIKIRPRLNTESQNATVTVILKGFRQ